jgi:hypothetical protein
MGRTCHSAYGSDGPEATEVAVEASASHKRRIVPEAEFAEGCSARRRRGGPHQNEERTLIHVVDGRSWVVLFPSLSALTTAALLGVAHKTEHRSSSACN